MKTNRTVVGVDTAKRVFQFWGEVTCPGEAAPRVLRVVTLNDSETIHNVFFDRRFRKDKP